jgi:general secretion pathway protein D
LLGITNALGDELIPPGMIKFQQADLSQVLDLYSEWVGRTILRPSTLPAPTITLTSKTPLTKKEAVQALDAVLALNGIAMVNVGEKFVKAVPEATGNTAGAPFNTNGAASLPELGQYVTHVVQLKYSKPSELVPILQPFSKIPTAILPIEGTQMLVLRDYAENVKRMLELVAQIDVAIPSEFVSEVIPIKYAKSSDIASALNSLSTGGGSTTIGGAGGAGGSRGTRSTGTGRTGGVGGTGGMGGMGGVGGYPGQTTPGMVTPPGGAGGQPGVGGSSFSQRLQNIIQRAGAPSSGEIQVLGNTKILADERTNSLLVYASKDDMKIIKDIIAKLDIVLAQVLIEAAVISVTLTDSRDLGINYLEQKPHGVGNYFKGLGAINNGTSLSQSPLISGATNIASTLPSGFSYLASFGQDLDVTLAAVASDSRARILQRPRIQTSHNEPASIFVGESRPYPTSSYYGGGAYGGYSSIQQLQIGVQLDVTPLINPDGLVVMDIHTKIDAFEGNVTIQNVGDVPVTSDKEAQAKVSVRDHDTIILGGLVETDQSRNNSGVPFLKDVPLLGFLFRSSHKDETRNELIVLIRPTVLQSPEIAALAATAEKNKMPGVRATEREIQAEEMQRLKQADSQGKANLPQKMPNP